MLRRDVVIRTLCVSLTGVCATGDAAEPIADVRAPTQTPAEHASEAQSVRIYRTRPLINLLEATGVVFRRRHWAHSLHAPYWWLKCLLGPAREGLLPVDLYHRFLTWDIMQKPRLTRRLEHLLNPILGKSLVLYFHKPA